MRNGKSCARGSSIAKHAWSSNHSVDFKKSQVMDKDSFNLYSQDSRIMSQHFDKASR